MTNQFDQYRRDRVIHTHAEYTGKYVSKASLEADIRARVGKQISFCQAIHLQQGFQRFPALSRAHYLILPQTNPYAPLPSLSHLSCRASISHAVQTEKTLKIA